MDFDLFLTYPRWEILQIIAERPSSPIEIAETLKTTVSYVSQQLKLLDAAGLLIKEKTGAAEKGKPRTLFRLSNELLYISVLTNKFSDKKLIYLSEHQKTIIRIWLLEDKSIQYYLEKLFWKLQNNLNEIDAILLEKKIGPKVIFVSDSKSLKTKVDGFVKSLGIPLSYSIISKTQLKKIPQEELIPLYLPDDIFGELKGGEMEENE